MFGKNDTTSGAVLTVSQEIAPDYGDPGWHYFFLHDRPVCKLPGNLPADATPRKRQIASQYWDGAVASWDQLRASVAEGWRIAVLPERSGLVVLDCDVRAVWRDEGSTARLELHSGIADLLRVAAERGKQIEPTYVVESPSGGCHLYYAQNPHCLLRSRGHRSGWLIDVKASAHTWALAPPTPGYQVRRDWPVSVLPYWLARHISGLSLRACGVMHPPEGGAGDFTEARREGVLRFVAESNVAGGWNNALYWAARRFYEGGEAPETALPLLLEAAAPWDRTEQAKAEATIRSAWNGHCEQERGGV